MSRYAVFIATVIASAAFAVTALAADGRFAWGLAVCVPLALLGVADLIQRRHSLLRNYPVIGHMRWMFEGVRPEIRQYLMESDQDAVPFSREKRSIVYQRAKNELDKLPFGTEWDVYADGYAWLNHSLVPVHIDNHDFRITVGGPHCGRPYEASIFNVSAMSFGSLSGNAIAALNKGARMGGFAHDTGEGSISRHHRQHGGDLIWELGSGYFGCRREDGGFDPDRFRDQAADEQVKMIEIKLSQGAKPGHGGVLPAAKISAEIAEARCVPSDRDCVSPARHPAFSTPREMMHFIQRLRELSGGKPVGIKLCVGEPAEFVTLARAMIEEQICPDFIVVDGKEGGTGAAPVEFTNRVGTPLVEGLTLVRDVLVGADLRDRIRIAASGKIVTAFDIVWNFALGADWCNAARGFMFAVGCIQAQSCHTNRCPVGVATQDPVRQRALVVEDKAVRVTNFHRNTLKALAEVIGAAGIAHPAAITPDRVMYRHRNGEAIRLSERFMAHEPGELLRPDTYNPYKELWRRANPDSFI